MANTTMTIKANWGGTTLRVRFDILDRSWTIFQHLSYILWGLAGVGLMSVLSGLNSTRFNRLLKSTFSKVQTDGIPANAFAFLAKPSLVLDFRSVLKGGSWTVGLTSNDESNISGSGSEPNFGRQHNNSVLEHDARRALCESCVRDDVCISRPDIVPENCHNVLRKCDPGEGIISPLYNRKWNAGNQGKARYTRTIRVSSPFPAKKVPVPKFVIGEVVDHPVHGSPSFQQTLKPHTRRSVQADQNTGP
jgi:hypothetical protein